jgi:hypothetical protein
MLLGALLDLGVPRRVVQETLGAVDVPGIRLRATRARRGAISALYVRFAGTDSAHERSWSAIRRLLGRSGLAPEVRRRSAAVFERLARAEARIHAVAPDRVHFHEVGALDSLADVVGVCAAIEHLQPTRVSSSSLALGHGSVATRHGRLPLPAPATLELLRGIPTHPLDVDWETVTPTGAALLAELVDAFGWMPALQPQAVGYGAGDDRRGPLPNTLRAVLGTAAGAVAPDSVSVIETNLDDMNPEQLPYLLERLMEDGALDASLSPVQMKKGRPGQLLRVIARPADRDRLARRVLAESTSLGVRCVEMSRWVLRREVRSVPTRYGPIRVKLGWSPDGRVAAAPEFESCARAARRRGVPLREVYRAAESAAQERLR